MRNEYPPIRRDEFGQRLHGENGRLLCRGCGVEVPKGRQTWCSKECFEMHDPATVRNKVFQRDGGLCVLCGIDVKKIERIAKKLKPHFGRIMVHLPWHLNDDWTVVKKMKEKIAERRQSVAERFFKKYSWTRQRDSRFWEIDHITPWAEGGATIVENMRTLCVPCHRKITAEWHRRRVMKRRGLQELAT